MDPEKLSVISEELPGPGSSQSQSSPQELIGGQREEEVTKVVISDAEVDSTKIKRELDSDSHSSSSQGAESKNEGKLRSATEVFPEEIWAMILEKVIDPPTLWSCYNTCALFRRILQPRKATWEFEHALPYLFPYLPGGKLLECRSVSTGWKEKMDQFLQNHPSLRPHNEETYNPRTLSFVNPLEEKGFGEKVEFEFGGLMLNLMPDLEDSEFVNATRDKLSILKTARLTIWCYDNPAYWEKVHKFLRTFREMIWYLSVHFVQPMFAPRCLSAKTSQFVFMDLFEYVPNIRKLNAYRVPPTVLMVVDEPFDPEIRFPIPHLETLEVRFCNENPQCPFLAGLLRRVCSQLGKVSLQPHVWDEVCRGLDWANLAELHLRECTTDQLASSLSQTALPNLAKLGLELSDTPRLINGRYRSHEFSTVVQVVTDLSSRTRLTTLRLNRVVTGFEMDVDEWTPTALCMPPTVTSVDLDYTEAEASHRDFSFLLYFPHLENLNVFHRKFGLGRREDTDFSLIDFGTPTNIGRERARQVQERDVVQLTEYMFYGEMGMYKSNIWELLPRLKVFTCQWDVYTRGEYEEYCMKRREAEGEAA